MAHEVESMMYLNQVPWHGLGIKIEKKEISIEEAIVASGLDWKVRLIPLIAQKPVGTEQVTHKAVMRESDSSILGVVGPGYHPLQNTEAFQFFNPFLSQKEATLETAGSLREGKRVWVLAKINRAPLKIVKGDEVEKFILLSNSHDGTMAVRVGFTPIRVVCANTLAMAHENGSSQLIRVFHNQKVVQNLEAVRDIMNAADAKFEATAEQYRQLARAEISEKDLRKYVSMVFKLRPLALEPGMSKEDRAKAADEHEKRQKVMGKVIQLFHVGRGNDMEGVKGTYWAAYNAVTEYLSYERGKNKDIRLDNLWFGEGANVNRKALDVAIQMAD